GFLCGLVFVVGLAIILYEIHLRIPLLKFLFSGKPIVKRENDKAPAQ
ncbi:glucans biosynthesis protein MdoC, partial [Escherichia albertii]|nr:glucans biosynthesis protein MdoC [Escherichia albertii]